MFKFRHSDATPPASPALNRFRDDRGNAQRPNSACAQAMPTEQEFFRVAEVAAVDRAFDFMRAAGLTWASLAACASSLPQKIGSALSP